MFGARVSKGVETLFCSVEGTWLDSILWEDGDASLHLWNLRDSEGDLFGGEGVWCGRGNAKLGPKELGGVVVDGTVRNTRLKIEKRVVTHFLMMLLMVADKSKAFLEGLDGVLGFLERLQGVGDFFLKLRRLSSLLVNSLIQTNEGTGFGSFGFLIERDSKVQVFHPSDEIIGGERRGVDHGERRWRYSNLRLEQASCRCGMLAYANGESCFTRWRGYRRWGRL